MNRSRFIGAIAMATLVASGCSRPDEKWENPGVSQSAWEVHEAECRRLASQRAEAEFAPEEPVIDEGIGRRTTYRTQVARYDASQRRSYLFDRCMKDRGYRRTATPPAEPAPTAPTGR